VRHVVMFSGGVGSWMTARRVVESGAKPVLLFADTRMEDEDLYRFLVEAAEDVGGQLVKVAEGRTPWEVFFDVRFLGNSRIDPCSRILKRELCRKWIEDNCDPTDTIIYIGIDWTESHRFTKAEGYWHPWTVKAPLCDAPYLTKRQTLDELGDIKPPALYRLGFPHNNCGGFCVKAGQAHFALLLRTMPDRYAFHEAKEQEICEYLGKKVTILRDRRGRETTPLSLKEFRERICAGGQYDMYEWGGCACFTPDDYEETRHESDNGLNTTPSTVLGSGGGRVNRAALEEPLRHRETEK